MTAHIIWDYRVLPGRPDRPGTDYDGRGINFSFAVPDGCEGALVLTRHADGKGRTASIPLCSSERVGNVNAVYLEGARPEEFGYYYEVDGKPVCDPYATEIKNHVCRVINSEFGRDDEALPPKPIGELMIYKLHVRGFTKKAKQLKHRGTFAGLAEMIPYISDLGFNAVELMPLYEFDSTLKVQPFSAAKEEGDGTAKAVELRNYWGYAEKNYYFAPKASYAASDEPSEELRSMIRAFHKAGIEVIMEMYFPEGTDPFMALTAIRFWKTSYHIDGFHFIGAGVPTDAVMRDPLLTGTRLMIEYADMNRIYQGRVPRRRNVLMYNEEFEHTGRALLKADEGCISEFAKQIRRNPVTHGFVHYMANVNGFTLFDAVSYDRKHNEANGENNRDGTPLNYSWNCGVEGPSRKKAVRLLRMKQVKNALLYTFLTQSVPLLYAGDESLNTQGGNNNAYASDDAVGWTDWSGGKEALEIREFVRSLTAFRRSHPILHMDKELRGTDYRSLGCPDMSFHDEKAWVCSFENVTRTLAVLYNGQYTREEGKPDDDYLYVAYNAFWDAHPFALPDLPQGYRWYPAINSAAAPGQEFAGPDAEPCADQKFCEASPRSVIVLRGVSDGSDQKSGPKSGPKSGKDRQKTAEIGARKGGKK